VPIIPSWKEWPEGRVRRAELRRLYASGYQGAYHADGERDELVDGFAFPTFADAAEEYDLRSFDGNAGGLYLPFLSVLELEPAAYDGAQETGDCVSWWAQRHADSVRANDILDRAEPESWRAEGATEPIYGWRETRRAGMSCARAVDYLTSSGGVILRKLYDSADLTSYNPALAVKWGRRQGTPDGINQAGRAHQIKQATCVEDLESMRVAFRCGYSVGGCSGLGLSARRDANGVSEPAGSWAHAMWWGGYDERRETVDAIGEPVVLVVNSWGDWNRGPRRILGTSVDMPRGACWVRESVIERRCLHGGGCYTFSGADGWPALYLPNLGATGEV